MNFFIFKLECAHIAGGVCVGRQKVNCGLVGLITSKYVTNKYSFCSFSLFVDRVYVCFIFYCKASTLKKKEENVLPIGTRGTCGLISAGFQGVASGVLGPFTKTEPM